MADNLHEWESLAADPAMDCERPKSFIFFIFFLTSSDIKLKVSGALKEKKKKIKLVECNIYNDDDKAYQNI